MSRLRITRLQAYPSLGLCILLLSTGAAWSETLTDAAQANSSQTDTTFTDPMARPPQDTSTASTTPTSADLATPQDDAPSKADIKNQVADTPVEPIPTNPKPAQTEPAKPKQATADKPAADMSPERLDEISIDQLSVLANNGKYEEGYALSKTLIDQWEGDPKFDFYYGLHALETGHYDEATFVFERLTTFDPNTLRYRLELARALYFNNNIESARAEFEIALKTNPPANVKTNIKRFLRRIDGDEAAARHSFHAGVGFNTGYDSNINSGTEEDGIEFPDIGFVTLNSEAQSIDSGFKLLTTKAFYSYAPKPRHSIDASFTSSHKRNDEVSTYDLDVLNFFAGYSWQPSAIRMQGGLTTTQVKLDGDDYQSQLLLNASALYTTKNFSAYGVAFNFGSRQSELDSLPDADLMNLAVNMSWQNRARKFSTLAVYAGSESVSDNALKHFGKSFYGGNYLSRYLLTPHFARVFSVNIQTNGYQAEQPVFQETRSDTSFMGSWGYEWTPWKYFTWRADASFSYNASNIDLYTYNRGMISTGVSLQF